MKGIFLDFYGTVVYEDGEIIDIIQKRIFQTGNAENEREIGTYWWKAFQEGCNHAYGENFKTQREIEYQSLQKTLRHFESTEDAGTLSGLMFEYWQKPPIFPDARDFFDKVKIPVYIVSNIDTYDIKQALNYHNLKPQGVFTSEQAKSYKPRSELFELALQNSGLNAGEVIHIGDSISSDIKGAAALGIKAIWLNRSDKIRPKEVLYEADSLLKVLEMEK